MRAVLDEPLVVIAPPGVPAATDADLLRSHPFIWFSRKTWAGQQIERRLLDRHIRVREAMEVDSLEAIAALVRHGLGVAIVPSHASASDLTQVPFGDPQMARTLVMIARPRSPKARLFDALHAAFAAVG